MLMSATNFDNMPYLKMAGVISDPLTRKILAKLSSKHSPINTNAIPIDKLNAKKLQIINRLARLENVNLVTSELIKSDNGYCRRYTANDNGKSIAKQLLSKELKEFS